MQTLYTLEAQDQDVKPGDASRILQKHFDQSRQLLSYLLYFIIEIARYAETDARNRASKHLPSEEDLNVNIKLAGNELLWKMLEDASLQKALETDKPHLQENRELIRKLYHDLVASEEYQQYIKVQGRDKKSERDMLEFVFANIMLPNESFLSHIEELFTNWDDDGDFGGRVRCHRPPLSDFPRAGGGRARRLGMLSVTEWSLRPVRRTARRRPSASPRGSG